MRRLFDNVVSLFVIVIVLLLIISVPPALLDVLILINISISFIILLMTMYVKEALEFSIFPSLLLVTTLFRLGINVSSTKLILGAGGQAGAVIATFGEFVIGGNAIVGFIIFIIILLIQFLVITKGAERVAEVSARFTLDAMPGKQMSIDADLNTGVITEQQARERREAVSREAEFYGSMDGATKFVKGDAILSLLVAVINLIGGLIIGSINGVPDVWNTYIIATVGDGLVSQIPALLISTATGMIVTRAASQNSLSKDVLDQFSRVPTAFIITGSLMFLLMFIPGFPKLVLFVIGGSLLALGIVQVVTQRRAIASIPPSPLDIAGADEPMTEAEFLSKPENIYSLIAVDPIAIEFGYSLLPIIEEAQGSGFADRLYNLRKNFAEEMGFVMPTITILDNIRILPSSYIIKIKGEEVASGEVLPGYYLVMDAAGLFENIIGIDTIEPTYGIPAKWVSAANIDRPEMMGYSVVDPQSVILQHLKETIRKYAHELLGRTEMNELIENVRKQSKSLVESTIDVSVPPLAVLNKVVKNLLHEDIPIKDMVTIIETAADYSAAANNDPDIITEYVRQALKRTITKKYAENGSINVVQVDVEFEKLLIRSIQPSMGGKVSELDYGTIQKVVMSLTEGIKKLDEVGAQHIVLTSGGVRIYFKQFIERFAPDIIVLSYDEIDTKINFQSFGVVTG